MNKLKLLSFLFFLLSTISSAQEYTPFYMDNARWVTITYYPTLGPEESQSFSEVYTLNDTTIEDKVYKTIAGRYLCQRTSFNGNWRYTQNPDTSGIVIGAIREENKKVYFRRFEREKSMDGAFPFHELPLGKDHLLYDFNIEEGDTIHFSDYVREDVSSGDTTYHRFSFFTIVFVELEPFLNHRRFWVHNSSAYGFPDDYSDLIEGIGSDHGFFGPYDSYLRDLTCFSVDGEPIGFLGCDPCQREMSTSTKEPNKEIQLEIFPNPVSSALNVSMKANFKINQIQILDSMGKLILENDYSESEIQVYLSNIEPGFYFIKVKFENGYEHIKKIVVQH